MERAFRKAWGCSLVNFQNMIFENVILVHLNITKRTRKRFKIRALRLFTRLVAYFNVVQNKLSKENIESFLTEISNFH